MSCNVISINGEDSIMNNNISALVPCRLRRFQGSHAQIVILLAPNSSEDEQKHRSMKSVNFERAKQVHFISLLQNMVLRLKQLRNILEAGDTFFKKMYAAK